MWHQHQPLYPKNEAGVVSRPWTRVHATKDYYDMAALVAQYPDLHVTFNLTPVLLRQLEEMTEGTKDIYWTMTEIPAVDLTEDERKFIIDRFFDANSQIVARFPRYQELIDRRDRPDSFTYRRPPGSSGAVQPGLDRPFFPSRRAPGVAGRQRETLHRGGQGGRPGRARCASSPGVIPLHAELWESGQIEVTTTPLAHPILPLIADTSLATVGDPTALMPNNRFRQLPDAVEQVNRASTKPNVCWGSAQPACGRARVRSHSW